MNRIKRIYFLSAIVLIIGCFALNKSYSLFVDTQTKDIVNSTVPNLEGNLSLTSVEVEAGKEYLIKQTINNTGTVAMNYAINASSSSTNYSVTLAKDSQTTYTSTGTVETNSSIDTYLVIKNTSSSTITINFTLNKKYTTLNNDLVSNIVDSTEVMSQPGIPYYDEPNTLKYHIINNFVNSDLYNSSSSSLVIVNDVTKEFNSGSTKISLPLSSQATELNVPSPTTFDNVETTEVGLYKAEDDYGMSYYFRGASSLNYVKFAGFTWRIVRINGDGSIRLILDGSLDKVTKEGEDFPVYENETLQNYSSVGTISFSVDNINDNAFLGYMFGELGSSTYDETHSNLYNSYIHEYLTDFYLEYVQEYDNYVANTLFCGDKTRAEGYTTLGFGEEYTLYSTYDRLWKNSNASPTLECANSKNDTDTLTESQRAYSRYISDWSNEIKTTSKGVLLNGALLKPIGLLSADELVMAGAYKTTSNTSYYLHDAYKEEKSSYRYWWTMTPYEMSRRGGFIFVSDYEENSLTSFTTYNALGVRPVINLHSDVLVVSGDGTKDTTVGEGPYIVTIN